MERLNNNAGLGGSFNTGYWETLKGAVAYVTSKGGYVVLDPHNGMRYNGRRIDNTRDFQNWWNRLAYEFRNDNRVIFEVMNSPEGVSAQQVVELNNAAINGIRDAGARSQLIIVEGTERSTAARWVSSGNGGAFNNRIRDPSNNFAIGFRQYFDSSGGGMNADCVSSSEGTNRIRVATDWLSANRYRGFLVEFGISSNSESSSRSKSCLPMMTIAML
jgi:endoglucanase